MRRLLLFIAALAVLTGLSACSSEPENKVGYTPDHAAERYGNIADPAPVTEQPTTEPPTPKPTPTLTVPPARALPKAYANKHAQPGQPCNLITAADLNSTIGRGFATTSRDGYTISNGYRFSGNGSETARIGDLAGNRRLCYYRTSDTMNPIYITVLSEAFRYEATARMQFDSYEDAFDDAKNAKQRSSFNGDEALYGLINQQFTVDSKKLTLRLSSMIIRVDNKLVMIFIYAPDESGLTTGDNLETLGQTVAARMA